MNLNEADIGIMMHDDLKKRSGKMSKIIEQKKKEMQGEMDRDEVKNDFLKGGDKFAETHLKGIVDVAKAGKLMKIARKIIVEGYSDTIEQDYTRALNAVDPNGVYQDMRKEYIKTRNLNVDPNATQEQKDNQMNVFLNKLAENKKKTYISGNQQLVRVRNALLNSKDPKAIIQINKELEPYFNDLENGGAIMRKVYNEIRQAKKRENDVNEPDREHYAEVAVQKIEEFLVLLHKYAMKWLDDYARREAKGLDVDGNPRNFFGIMYDVLFENKSAALSRLGGYIATWWKYSNLTNQVDDEDL